jgi:outer membrane lipoprotein-sorting protein
MRHLLVLTIAAAAAAATVAGTTAENVLSKLDAAAPGFTGMTANLSRVTYTKVLDEQTTESGTIALRKQGPGIQVLITLTKPDEKLVAFRGKKAEIYYPKLKTVEEWDLGKHSGLIDQFLLVGFGTGKALKSSYAIKYVGDETVAGQKTWKLELTPQAAEVKDKLRRVDLWVAENGAYPVQQRFVQPSGDYYLVTYTDVKLNPALTDEALRLNLPKGVKRTYPQK